MGDHIDQKGSIVLADKLRFDFSNPGPIEADKLAAVEKICQDIVKVRGGTGRAGQAPPSPHLPD